MISPARLARLLALCAILAAASFHEAEAQWAIGLGFNIAETDTNAVGLGSTVTWSPTAWFALRGFLDAELGIPDLKTGLRYEEPDREYIEDGSGTPQNPKGDDLWQSQGWQMHAASYATVRVWLISAGPGFAYNGHDGSGTSGFAFTLVGDLSTRSELDIEFLQGGSWRMRVAVFFWQF